MISFYFVCCLLWGIYWVKGYNDASTTTYNVPEEELALVRNCVQMLVHYQGTKGNDYYHSQNCDLLTYKSNINLQPIFGSVNLTLPDIQVILFITIQKGLALNLTWIKELFNRPVSQYKFQVPLYWSMGNDDLDDNENAKPLSPKPKKSLIQRLISFLFKKKEKIQLPYNPFIFSDSNERFFINEISQREFEDFKDLMMPYAKHIEKNPRSFLLKVFGMFRAGSKYYVLFLSPMSIHGIGFVVSGFEKEENIISQCFGNIPFGNYRWKKASKATSKPVHAMEEYGTDIFQIFNSDLKFLNENGVIDYGLFLGVQQFHKDYRSSEEIGKSLQHVWSLHMEDREFITISLWNFFKKERNSEDHSAKTYAQSIQLFTELYIMYDASKHGNKDS